MTNFDLLTYFLLIWHLVLTFYKSTKSNKILEVIMPIMNVCDTSLMQPPLWNDKYCQGRWLLVKSEGFLQTCGRIRSTGRYCGLPYIIALAGPTMMVFSVAS